jgi:hypothetical protein
MHSSTRYPIEPLNQRRAAVSILRGDGLFYGGGFYDKAQSEASSEVPPDAAPVCATKAPTQEDEVEPRAVRTAILATRAITIEAVIYTSGSRPFSLLMQ